MPGVTEAYPGIPLVPGACSYRIRHHHSGANTHLYFGTRLAAIIVKRRTVRLGKYMISKFWSEQVRSRHGCYAKWTSDQQPFESRSLRECDENALLPRVRMRCTRLGTDNRRFCAYRYSTFYSARPPPRALSFSTCLSARRRTCSSEYQCK